MDKRQSVLCLVGVLLLLCAFVTLVTPPLPPSTAARRLKQKAILAAEMAANNDDEHHHDGDGDDNNNNDGSLSSILNNARATLRDANRTYHTANGRINHFVDGLTPSPSSTSYDEGIDVQRVQPKVATKSSTSTPSTPKKKKGSSFCAMRPGACEFNQQQHDAMSEWAARSGAPIKCRSPSQLGRSSSQPVTIQLMDDLGGWSHIMGPIIDSTNRDGTCNTHCRVTPFGGGNEANADILLTSLYHEPANLPRDRRKPHQVMAAIGLEAWAVKPAMYDQMDILMSHHPQSQVPVNYYYGLGERCAEADKTNPDEPLLCLDRSMPNFKEKRDDAYSGLFITNCNAAVRRGYLKELGTYIPLHSYGSCLHTAGLSALQGQGAKRREAQKYKFFISFENTVLDGYLTEKFFEGFSMNTLMVYWGSPDMEKWLPANHSAINVHDFAGPKQLAEFLKTIASDEHKWNSYFEWKKNDLSSMRPEFAARASYNLANRGKNNFLCRVCDYYAEHYCS